MTDTSKSKGDQGQRGASGDQGYQGDQGTQGDQGERGVPGNQGIRGYQGERGLRGYQGDNVTVSGVRSWLPFFISIVLMIVSLTVSWTKFDNGLSVVKADELRLEQAFADHIQDVELIRTERDKQYLDMQVLLAQIQRDIAYIRIQVDAK